MSRRPDKTVFHPLLILDLDDTLLHTSTVLPARTPDFSDGAYHTLLRPHLREFLLEAQKRWNLAVFTAGGQFYARDMIEGIRRTTRVPFELEFVFDRRRCTPRTNFDTGEQVQLKDLKKVKRLGYRLERTLIIDDKPAGLARHRGNILRAPEWTGDPADTFLKDVLPLLEHLAQVENIRTTRKLLPTLTG